MPITRAKLLRGLRLLPVLVVASALLLTVRLGELTSGIEIGGTTVALAETKDDAESAADAPVAATTEASSSDRAEDEFNIVTDFTEAELELLQDLSKRRDQLVARETELESRTRLLDAAESRLAAQIAELQELRKTIEGLVRKYDEQEQAEIESVVKIYETMKPKDAARILGELEMKTLLGIMERMNVRKTAPILAAMPPERARSVTSELARQRAVDLAPGMSGDG
jgi:flagellar motility protein MotE (MotC chaperone)